jgi:FxsC-like protein
MSARFFLSHARADDDAYVLRFHEDLTAEVRAQPGLSAEQVSLFDRHDIKSGDSWAQSLLVELQESSSLVCLYSPSYFNSRHCIAEWQFFRRRVDELREAGYGQTYAYVILPVIWTPFDAKSVPAELSPVQYVSGADPEAYSSKGLRGMLRLQKYEALYFEVLRELAERIARAAEQPLPPLKNPPPLSELERGPLLNDTAATDAVAPAAAKPGAVNFVYVAGSRAEMSDADNPRQNVEAYGADGREWRPFLPQSALTVEALTQQTASENKLLYNSLPVDEGLAGERIRECAARNELVILLVDPWALRFTRYHRIMREFAAHSFFNCATLILWNADDAETAEQRESLEMEVEATFYNLRLYTREDFFRAVTTPEELGRKLSETYYELRARLLMRSAAEHAPRSSTLPGLPTLPRLKLD